MQIKECLERASANAKETKEWATRKRPGDINPYICCYRGEEPIAIVTLKDHMRDEILEAAATSAVGFDADVLSIAFETYAAVSSTTGPDRGINPHTGREWGPHEMQDVAHNHDGVAKGWVSEAVSVAVASRAGDVAMNNRRFHYSGRHLVWDDDELIWQTAREVGLDDDDGTGHLSGLMVNALRRIMLGRSGFHLMPEGWGSLDRAEQDVVTARALGLRFGCATLLVADGDDDARVRRLLREHRRAPGTGTA